MPIEAGTHAGQEASRTTLMVLGKNIGEDWTGDRIRRTPGHLSPWGEIGADSGGIAIEDGDAEVVTFTITNTAGSQAFSREEAEASGDIEGTTPKTEADYMRSRFQTTYPHLADRAFIQPHSWDTNTDAKEARKLIENGDIDPDNWILATIGFHLSRAVMLFRRAGVKINEAFATEELIGRRDPDREREIKASDLYRREQKKERRIRFVQSLPFAADAITAITKRSRTK